MRLIAQPSIIVLAAALLAGGSDTPVSAQENIRTPSQTTKEAVEKLAKTPATIGKSLESLTEAAKAKFRQALGEKAPAKEKVEPEDLTLPPKKGPETPAARFSAEGKRDPFRPFNMRARTHSRPRENLSPLERLELGQLKIVGIIWDVKEPRAMVEDNGGLGYIVKVGTPIGNNDGAVKAIRRNEVVVEETYADIYGAKKRRDVTMKLSVE